MGKTPDLVGKFGRRAGTKAAGNSGLGSDGLFPYDSAMLGKCGGHAADEWWFHMKVHYGALADFREITTSYHMNMYHQLPHEYVHICTIFGMHYSEPS